jgi:hypothetical protein
MGPEMHWPKDRMGWILLLLAILLGASLIAFAYLRRTP